MTVAAYIAKALKEEGRTKTWLSELLGITKQQLHYRFQNDAFSATEFIRIVNALDLDLEELKEELSEERVFMSVLATIARNTKKMEKVGAFTDEYATTIEYGIATETKILKVWNSSNQEDFDHDYALDIIAEQLEDGDSEGEFSDGNFNSIRWEIIDK